MKNIKQFSYTPINIVAFISFILTLSCARLPEDTEQELPILGQWEGECYPGQTLIFSGTSSSFVNQAEQTVYSFTSSNGIRKIKKTVKQYQSKSCDEENLASTLIIEGAITLDESDEKELVQQTIDISYFEKRLIAHTEKGVSFLSSKEDYRDLDFVIGVEQTVLFTQQLYDIFLIEADETQSVLQLGNRSGTLDGKSEETRPDTLNKNVSFTLIEN